MWKTWLGMWIMGLPFLHRPIFGVVGGLQPDPVWTWVPGPGKQGGFKGRGEPCRRHSSPGTLARAYATAKMRVP
jgi:hypothetical protein